MPSFIQDRQKASADLHRRPVDFSVGDTVLLKPKNLQLKKPEKSAKKFMPKWIGPFTVTQLIGPVALKLELPTPWRIHPVFHVSLIKPYLSDGMVQPPQPLSYLKGEPQFSADYILNKRIVRKGHKSATQYLIRWTDCGPANDTWEPSSNISNKDLISDFLARRSTSVRED